MALAAVARRHPGVGDQRLAQPRVAGAHARQNALRESDPASASCVVIERAHPIACDRRGGPSRTARYCGVT